MSKTSWVILEISESGGDKEIVRALAGTEDRRAVTRMLASLKLFHDECIRTGKPSDTIIHSSLEDEATNPLVAEMVNTPDDIVGKLLNMMDDDLVAKSV